MLPGLRRAIVAQDAGPAGLSRRPSPTHDIVVGIGPAGTGKTYLAVAKAVEALARKRVKRIILARPAVEAGESLGFLPGDLQAKVDPYLRPLYDALEDMMPHDRVQKALETRTIEIAPLAYMRGRTLSDAFIILDEAQNATGAQMKMFLTRLGVNSQVVVTGDKTQIDLPHAGGLRPDPDRADSARHRRHRVLLPGRDRRGAPPAGAGDHPRLRRGPERLKRRSGCAARPRGAACTVAAAAAAAAAAVSTGGGVIGRAARRSGATPRSPSPSSARSPCAAQPRVQGPRPAHRRDSASPCPGPTGGLAGDVYVCPAVAGARGAAARVPAPAGTGAAGRPRHAARAGLRSSRRRRPDALAHVAASRSAT